MSWRIELIVDCNITAPAVVMPSRIERSGFGHGGMAHGVTVRQSASCKEDDGEDRHCEPLADLQFLGTQQVPQLRFQKAS